MQKCLPCLVLLLPALFVTAQNNQFDIFYNQTNSRCHFQQADTIWVGCEGGLLKRLAPSGEVIAAWDANNSPLNQPVSDLWVDQQNRIWLALGEGGVARKDGDNWTFWSTADIAGNDPDANIYSIAADENGKAWAYDWSSQLIYWYQDGEWKLSDIPYTVSGYNVRFINDTQNRLWWINSAGVHRYQDSVWQHYQAANTGFCDAKFRKDGRLIVSTQDGRLLRFQPNGSFSLMGIVPNGFGDCHALALDTLGKVYLARGTGLTVFTGTAWETYYAEYNSFNDNTPRQMSADNYGNVWMSRYNYGILQKFSNGTFETLRAGIVGGNSVCSDQSGENIWFNSIYFTTRLHVPTMQCTQYELDADLIYNFAAGPDGQMWLASSAGLYHFEGNSWNLVTDPTPGADQYLYSVAVGAADEVLGFGIGTDFIDLVKIYHTASNTWEHHLMGQNGVPAQINWTPFREPNGRLWFPGWEGISSYYLGEWTWMTPANSTIPFPDWYRVAVTPDGRLWATRQNTLYSYDGANWTLEMAIPCYYPWNNLFVDLFVDSRGWLWTVKNCGVISVYDGNMWTHFDPSNSNLPETYFGKIAEDHVTDLWIGASPAVRYHVAMVGTGESAPLNPILQIAPNPAVDEVMLRLPGTAGSLELSDAAGRVLRRQAVAGASVVLTRENLPDGIYFIRFTSDNGETTTQKFIFH